MTHLRRIVFNCIFSTNTWWLNNHTIFLPPIPVLRISLNQDIRTSVGRLLSFLFLQYLIDQQKWNGGFECLMKLVEKLVVHNFFYGI